MHVIFILWDREALTFQGYQSWNKESENILPEC